MMHFAASAPSTRTASGAAAPRPTVRIPRPGPGRTTIPSLDRASLAAAARALFIGVQNGLALRDMGMLRNRVTPEMHAALQARCDQLRAAKQSNRIEKIDITNAAVEDAWEERDRVFATVRLCGTLFDYTVDDATGKVLDGSKTAAQRFEERWTFVRAADARAWRLAGIDGSVS